MTGHCNHHFLVQPTLRSGPLYQAYPDDALCNYFHVLLPLVDRLPEQDLAIHGSFLSLFTPPGVWFEAPGNTVLLLAYSLRGPPEF
jgi:hypothetical protein